MEAMWTRWLPHMVRIRELVRSGAIGEPRDLIADHGLKLSKNRLHRVCAPELGGGALLDLGIYPVSFAWDLFGRPDRILAMSDLAPTGVDGMASILLGFPHARQAALQTVLDARSAVTATVFGTEARIEIDSYWYFPNGFRMFDPTRALVETFDLDIAGRGMQFQALEMDCLVAEGRHPSDVLPYEESVAIMATLDEIRRQIELRFPGETMDQPTSNRE